MIELRRIAVAAVAMISLACGSDAATGAGGSATGGTSGGGAGGTSGTAGASATGGGAQGGTGGSGAFTGGTGGASGHAGSSGTAGGGGFPHCPASCEPIPGAPPYESLVTAGDRTDRPPAEHADLNPKLRGWASCLAVSCGATGGTLGLIQIPPGPGGIDDKAPRLHTLLQPERLPTFAENHRGYDWDWGCTESAHGCKGDLIEQWDVHWAGFATTPDEVLRLPTSGYDIGQGHQARVLFADEDTVTLKYTGEDNVVTGYTIHVVGICLEPGLRTKYEADDGAGRDQLPALRAGDPLGRACGVQTLVSVRDTGSFMDPRSETDWWQGHP